MTNVRSKEQACIGMYYTLQKDGDFFNDTMPCIDTSQGTYMVAFTLIAVAIYHNIPYCRPKIRDSFMRCLF